MRKGYTLHGHVIMMCGTNSLSFNKKMIYRFADFVIMQFYGFRGVIEPQHKKEKKSVITKVKIRNNQTQIHEFPRNVTHKKNTLSRKQQKRKEINKFCSACSCQRVLVFYRVFTIAKKEDYVWGSIINQSRTNGPINAHLTIAQV